MPERLIVDGYNVLYAWARRPGAPPIPMARETLLRDLERAAATRGVRCTVVFDGRPIEDVAHASSALLEVLFAGPHSSADAVIERMVCRSPRQGQVVVTDDRLLGHLAVGWGCSCWSTTQFAQWLAAPP
ncbi:MAG: hypothetical protein A3C53_06860 [Omnitrophica WOR_2 bacterium RIFCSPHIGHO2_02_FULL_68_15]|nr:MAG: hypothetical protein A3C53_06860 [Omnitrophica WOR_2 bacterium RIFCSPHIGHO2_02_FULL_68_15]